jgi:hypothetical protein
MKYEIRELSIGEILDQAITLTKNHFGSFFSVVAVTLLPIGLIQAGVNIAIMPETPLIPTPEELAAIEKAQMENLPIIGGMGLLVLLVVPIANAALVRIVAHSYLGKNTSTGDAVGSAFGLLLPLYWTWMIMAIAVMGGMILLVIPGIIAAFWFSLTTQVVVVERVSGVAALKRSRNLMRGNVGTVFVLGIVLGMISIGMQVGSQFIPQIHAKNLAAVLINCVFTIFSSVAMVVFYFSCRCKNEHFDLQLLAQNVAGEATGDVAAGSRDSDDNPFNG